MKYISTGVRGRIETPQGIIRRPNGSSTPADDDDGDGAVDEAVNASLLSTSQIVRIICGGAALILVLSYHNCVFM